MSLQFGMISIIIRISERHRKNGDISNRSLILVAVSRELLF